MHHAPYDEHLSSTCPAPVYFDTYNVLKRLHRGRNGTIYLITPKYERLVLKVIDKSTSKRRLAQALTEQRTLREVVNNAQFTRLVRSWHDTKHFYLVLDYYPETLADALAGPSFDISRARVYAAGIFTALSMLHSKQIIHRDINAFNIFFRSDGQVVLGGFAKCATLKPDPTDPSSTSLGITDPFPPSKRDALEFMSPERLYVYQYSFESDVWSVGVLIYRMVVGRLPFRGNTIDELRQSVYDNEIDFPEDKDIDPATQDLVSRLLCRDPANRLTNIDEIQRHPYFKFIDWSTIVHRRTISPWRPNVSNYPIVRHSKKALTISRGDTYDGPDGSPDPHPDFTFENNGPACATTEVLYPQAYRNLPSTMRMVTGSRCARACGTVTTEGFARSAGNVTRHIYKGLGILHL